MNFYKDKILLISGGTGSFGKEVLFHLLKSEASEIRVYSRDETKQDALRNEVLDERLNFIIGDVRDKENLNQALSNVDYVFHAAALKQVPSAEINPLEAIKTNILGTNNILSAAYKNKCKKVVCLSTDKAVHPVNAMGMTKSLMEKLVMASNANKSKGDTIVTCTRYGNVLASRGSVIPLFISQIKKGLPITLTDKKMTRFLMTLTEAVELVDFAFENSSNADIFVKKSPAASVETISEAVRIFKGVPDHPIKIIGSRPGEKVHESLLSAEELNIAEDMGDFYKLSNDSINQLPDEGFSSNYSSNSKELMNVDQVLSLLQNYFKN